MITNSLNSQELLIIGLYFFHRTLILYTTNCELKRLVVLREKRKNG